MVVAVVHTASSLFLVAAEHAADDGQAAESLAALLATLLLVVSAEAEGTQQLVDTKATEQAVDQTQDIHQQETDGCEDLEQRLGHQAPQRVELLLCVVDGSDDRGGELLEALGQAVLLGSSLAGTRAALGLGSDLAVGVEARKGAVALLQNAAGLLDEA